MASMDAPGTTPASGAERPLRADARRNRARVLAAAQEAFTEEGKLVPLDEIARRAGVGAGTVYRHFSTKEALFEAVFVSRVEKLIEVARTKTEAPDPGAAFYAFLSHMFEEGRAKRELVDAMAVAGIDVTAPTSPAGSELRSVIGTLLNRGQEAGAVREDIGTTEVMALLAGTVIATQRHGGDEEVTRRIFTVLCDGLRAGARL